MRVEAGQATRMKRVVKMHLNAEDFKELLGGGAVYYEQRRTFSELELTVDLTDVPKDLLVQPRGEITVEQLKLALMHARWTDSFDIQKAVDELNGKNKGE
jgi:hypothetical protein